PGLGLNDDARRLAEFRLVVRREDLVFLDRQLRERVARVAGLARTGLAADATVDVVLLAHTVDVDVDVAVELSTPAHVCVATAVDVELNARYLVGKLEEVAGVLRQGVDVVQGDHLSDFRSQRFLTDGTAGDRDFGQLRRQVQLSRRGHLQRDRLLGSGAGINGVIARRLCPGFLPCTCFFMCSPSSKSVRREDLCLWSWSVAHSPRCVRLLTRRAAAPRPPGRRRGAAAARAPQDSRTTSSAGMVSVDAAVASGALIAAASRSSARAPSSAIRTPTAVSGGETKRAIGMSSTPASAISAGTRTCASLKAKRLPSAIM